MLGQLCGLRLDDIFALAQVFLKVLQLPLFRIKPAGEAGRGEKK